MRKSKKLMSVLLVLLLAVSSMLVLPAVSFTAGAAAGDVVYFQAPSGWSTPYCYAWITGASDQNAAWPGTAMTHVKDSIYSYTLTAAYAKVIFNNSGSPQTEDLAFAGANKMYVFDLGSWVDYTGEIVEPPPVPAENLITDSSFEQSGFWNYGGISQSGDKALTGTKSAKSGVRGMAAAICTSKQLTVKANTDYVISGNIFRGDDSTWAYIDLNDIAGEVQLRAKSVGKWQNVTGVWNSGSLTTVTVRLVIERNWSMLTPSYTGITGDAWFDDVTFTPIDTTAYSEAIPEVTGSAQKWTLLNGEIKAVVASEANKEYILELTNVGNGEKWIDTATSSPLIKKISGQDITWSFKDAQLTGGGAQDTKLVLNYTSTSPALRLKSVWEVKAEGGPLYHYSEVYNDTGAGITINSDDVISSEMLLKIPSSTTLYRFNRSKFNNGLDGLFKTGVLTNTVSTSFIARNTVENSWEANSGLLPFEMLQANGHGFYVGYDWGYGEMMMRTQKDSTKLRLTANLGRCTEQISRTKDEVFTVPGVFYGTYTGSPDTGSNKMKAWFWKNYMTPDVVNNPSEPPIEQHLPLYDEANLKNYLNKYDLASWGVGLTKMDYWWTVPTTPGDANSGFDSIVERQWLPNAGKWPNGMTYGKLVKEKWPGMKVSLYMCDTFEGVDIGTKEGRDKQIAALTQRFNDWKIDYWRSDFDLLEANNYANQEGLNYILDTMEKNFPNFRFECCSCGGALKDFQTARRMSFITMEDSGGVLNHRMAYYSNVYMFNPVQLKFDMGFDWSSPEDAGNIGSNQTEWSYYNLRSAMMGAMMVQNVSGDLSQTQVDASKACYNQYNTKQREILRNGDAYHILPMPTGGRWDGMQFYNKKIEKGSVFLFSHSKNGGSDGPQKTIKLDGLEPTATYKLTFQDRTSLNCSKTGKELMETGVLVTGMTECFDSEIIWIERTGGPTVLRGDANGDGVITLKDATTIQKYLASMVTLTEAQLLNADANNDGTVSLKDATTIQKYLAGLIPSL